MNHRPPTTADFATTLVELLCDRGAGECAERGFTFFRGDDVEDQWLRYSELHLAAQRIAAELKDVAAKIVDDSGTTGRPAIPDRAIVLCPPGPSYLKALFGAFYCGMIAVTAYPPRARRRDERLDGVIDDSRASIALVDHTIFRRRDQILKSSPALRNLDWVNVDDLPADSSASWTRPSISPDATAMLQYTSGSTANAKGVCLTHRNLLSNSRSIYELFDLERYKDQWCVTWLPPYHDMGLIGGLFQVLYAGVCSHVIPPAAFIQKPIRWLRAITKYGASISGGPNFAYDLCVDRISESDRASLDLSSWSLAFTGSEPIRAKSLDRFASAFASSGFKRKSYFPCYGLAEATLIVSGGPRGREPVIGESPDESTGSKSTGLSGIENSAIVSCGKVASSQQVRIVDPQTLLQVQSGWVGEIWVAGENVSPGYWERPDATSEVFDHRLEGEVARFMRTGDLGYLDDGELFVSGRLKELIVIRGRNFQPSDIEAAAADCSPLLVPNAAAAFEVETDNGVALAVVHEVDGYRPDQLPEVVRQIRGRIVERFELEPHQIVLIPRRALPKTSSGKVQRLETKRLYEHGELASLVACTAADSAVRDLEDAGNGPQPDSDAISTWLVRRLANQLQVDSSAIDVSRPFVQYGLDSVSAVQIASDLEAFLGRELPATLLYEAPTIAAVAERLRSKREGPQKSDSEPLAGAVSVTTEPTRDIAIVGVACVLPGSDGVQEFWQLLRSGQTAIVDPPDGRHDCVSDSATTRRAGWISRPDLFDAELFGISPREARCIDPQHRMLLEICWRAIEDAGIDPKRLSGTKTGAYVGISNRDYERLILRRQADLSTYSMTGNAASMAANRLSYHFDLRGPSLAVDTACSSSLVAVHQAVRAIQTSDCDSAIVAGVNLILSPEVSDTLSDAEMLSPQGWCKTFDAEANGYVRGEGCVALLLKPLSDAIGDGDPIRAVIRGSAINQDGLTNGITAPNGDSQVRLYRDALANASLRPTDISLLEAHGTGTSLGDPIEVQSLKDVYGSEPWRSPCHLGAVKANVGHLEAAAGLVSLLKVILELQHRETVPQPNLATISPHIDLTDSRITIPTDSGSWEEGQPRIAAVSSFGFGGTNAHVIVAENSLERSDAAASNEADFAASSGAQTTSSFLVTLSACNPDALNETAAAHARMIDQCTDLGRVAEATQQQKTSHRHRVAIVGESSDMIASRLRQFALGETSPAIQAGTAPTDRSLSIAFLFSGQGGQDFGMGRGLYRRSKTFRQWVDRCNELLQDEFDCSVVDFVASKPNTNGKVAPIPESPTARFVLQWALARTLISWGINSTTVMGHGVGEYVAAAVSEVMDWQDALRLTVLRASCVADLESVSDSLLDSIGKTISGFTLNTPNQTFVSTLTGSQVCKELQSADYWMRQFGQPSQLVAALETIEAERCDVVLEIGSDSILGRAKKGSGPIAACGPSGTSHYSCLTPFSLAAGGDDRRSILEMLAKLFVRGAKIQWDQIGTHQSSESRIVLPGHPFHRKRYWIDRTLSDSSTKKLSGRNSLTTGMVTDSIVRNRQSAVTSTRENGFDSSGDELTQYSEAMPQVDKIVVAAMRDAVRELGDGLGTGDRIVPESLVSKGVVAKRHLRLLTRICEILEEDGVLRKESSSDRSGEQRGSDVWTAVAGPPTHADLSQQVAELETAFPIVKNELRLVARCGRALPQVLRGKLDPLAVLFPGGDASELQKLYRASPIAKTSNRLVAQAARAVIDLQAQRDPNRVERLRVLEVGAGTGGTTSFVLPAIGDRIETYVFTDASALLVADSSSRFGVDSGVEYQRLDIESSPREQGFEEGSFDLVIGANVFHATQDLRVSLSNARRLLRGNGFLIALEGVRREHFLDLVFGLTEGWWRFSDSDLRPSYPLISEQQWTTLLRDCGFDDPTGLPFPEGDELARECQTVVIAGVSEGEFLQDDVGDRITEKSSQQAFRGQSPDRSAIAAQWIEAFRNGTADDRPKALEGYFRESVSAVLGHPADDLDLDQPVSNLGLDSLMAIQLKNRLETDLGISVPMIVFLEGKSVRQLIDVAIEAPHALSVGDSHSNADTELSRSTTDTTAFDDSRLEASDSSSYSELTTDVAEISQTGERVLGPMSEGQLALWMIHQRAPSGPAYNFAFAARTSGSIDHEAMTKACRSLVKRHPDLRTRYRLDGDAPVRVLSRSTEVLIDDKDCHDWKESRIVEWIRSEADRPFDLEHGPVIRFSLLRCKSGDVLSIAMHHITADLWSMDVLIQELIDLYAMVVGGGAIELGPLPTTYDAYVQWERNLDRNDEGSRLWKFWREKLHGAPHTLALPTTYNRPREQTYNGRSHEWVIPPEIVDGLRQVAHAERTTMFTIVLAAYQVFLARICGQDDLLVGTVSASRGRSEWEGIVGYFLNHLVLRTRIVGSPTFRDVLRDSQREVLDALENQAFPFAKLVQKIRPVRDPSRSPIVQTMFIWDKPGHLKESHFAPGKSSDRLRLKPLLMEQRGAPFDLTLIVFELEEELKLTFRYNSDLFSHEAIEALSQSLELLIETVANDPDTPVRSTPLVPSDQEELMATWNATDAPFDATMSGYALFRQFVDKTPDAVAIESADETLTYAQSESRASKIAHELRELSVSVGDVVALMVPRGVDAIVGILGIWKAGAAYLPLDPDHPTARLQAICDDAAPDALLCSVDDGKHRALDLRCGVVDLVQITRSKAAEIGDEIARDVDPDSPAYMIYTSGSTGRPKGVVLAHRGVANLALAQHQTFGIVPGDRCLQFASLSFDASVFEIIMAFHAGASLFVLDAGAIRSTTTATADAIRRSQVSVATLPPSLLAAIPAEDLPDLRTVISAGEVCSASLVRKWGEERQMFNAYGPTEATVWASTELCKLDGFDPSLGRPIANVRAYVVDSTLEPMPLGIPGELCLSGPGLAIEYNNMPDATADMFVPNPQDDRFDATMYRSGDRARWTHDGTLEFLGRIDDQVKIDGHRIELGEIASVIRQMPVVENAFVTTVKSAATQHLVAYVVLLSRSESDADVAAIRQHLSTLLPCYMVPKQFVRLERFALTTSGKVDANKLPKPADLECSAETTLVAPTTPTQVGLVEIWREVLQLDDIGIHDNFFELGGASLQALQAADRATRRGYDVSAERMFQFQTIAQLAREIDSPSEAAPLPEEIAQLHRRPGPVLAIDDDRLQRTARTGPGLRSSQNLQRAAEESDAGQPRMVIESIGMYLPPEVISTAEVVQGCHNRLDFPLQKMTGIASRHVAGHDEFSIDLARQAATDCLERSRLDASDIDLLIACNISRYDGPDFEISYEPSTASKLKQQIGAASAVAFDVCNACAGFFTALAVAEARLRCGESRRAMIVSGEYITHLTKTAQLEINGFLDPRLACLTLGDAGVAVIVELTDDGFGFETLELYTAGRHHELCVARATDQPHGGAIMLTDAIKASAVTLNHSVSHAHRVVDSHHWDVDDVRHVIMHQTSSTTLDGAIEELNRHFGHQVCSHQNTVNNLAHRGNTASTTHWVAVMDLIRQGRIKTGDKAVFAISGSGQTIGTALYQFDSLPDRIMDPTVGSAISHSIEPEVSRRKYGVQIVAATVDHTDHSVENYDPRFSGHFVVESAASAVESCLQSARWNPNDVEMLIHAGIYRDDFLSEPAVAAILAGELKMNDDLPHEPAKQTLAFDLLDAGRGALTACNVICTMIHSGRITRGIVSASEVENNSHAQNRRGVAELGSAIALQRTDDVNLGFGDFFYRSYPEFAGKFSVSTRFDGGSAALIVDRAEDLEQIMVRCVGDCVSDFLASTGATIGRYDCILLSLPSSIDRSALAKVLGASVQSIRVPDLAEGDGDVFTSGLAALWSGLASTGPTPTAAKWLLVSAGAGIEVACVEYQH